MEVAHDLGYKTKYRMESALLGPEYDNDYIEKVLKGFKLSYERQDDIAGAAAKLLAQNKIVGWFQGRVEFGPRALGSRSILMSPKKRENTDIINAEVKFREAYRPFCPSMLYEAMDEYLEGAYESPFMILSFKVPEDKVKEIPAVVHVDGTCRPQTVKKDVNPIYWKLIKEFESETGTPVILNTSYNVKGLPIVCTPQQALADFFACGLDYLAIGNFLVKK